MGTSYSSTKVRTNFSPTEAIVARDPCRQWRCGSREPRSASPETGSWHSPCGGCSIHNPARRGNPGRRVGYSVTRLLVPSIGGAAVSEIYAGTLTADLHTTLLDSTAVDRASANGAQLSHDPQGHSLLACDGREQGEQRERDHPAHRPQAEHAVHKHKQNDAGEEE